MVNDFEGNSHWGRKWKLMIDKCCMKHWLLAATCQIGCRCDVSLPGSWSFTVGTYCWCQFQTEWLEGNRITRKISPFNLKLSSERKFWESDRKLTLNRNVQPSVTIHILVKRNQTEEKHKGKTQRGCEIFLGEVLVPGNTFSSAVVWLWLNACALL